MKNDSKEKKEVGYSGCRVRGHVPPSFSKTLNSVVVIPTPPKKLQLVSRGCHWFARALVRTCLFHIRTSTWLKRGEVSVAAVCCL